MPLNPLITDCTLAKWIITTYRWNNPHHDQSSRSNPLVLWIFPPPLYLSLVIHRCKRMNSCICRDVAIGRCAWSTNTPASFKQHLSRCSAFWSFMLCYTQWVTESGALRFSYPKPCGSLCWIILGRCEPQPNVTLSNGNLIYGPQFYSYILFIHSNTFIRIISNS